MIMQKIISFSKTQMGKAVNLLMALIIFNLQSCTVYQASEIEYNVLSDTKQIVENTGAYKFYLFDGIGYYYLDKAFFNTTGDLVGEVIPINSYERPDSSWTKDERKKYFENHIFDVCLQLNYTLVDYSASVSNEGFIDPAKKIIKSTDVTKVTITTVDREKQMIVAAVAVLLVLGVLVLTSLLVLITTVAVTASSDGSSASSDGSSSGSDSSSDSGSGGSSG